MEDYDDNAINPENSTFTTADAESPTVTFDPADGVTDVVVSKTIKLTFSEAIRDTADTALTDTNVDGHITLKRMMQAELIFSLMQLLMLLRKSSP